MPALPAGVKRCVRAWRRRIRNLRARPGTFVRAEAWDPGIAWADSAYNGLCVASDGRVFFAVSTHHPDHSATICCLDPVSDTLRSTCSLDTVIADPADALPHGKIHVPLAEYGGRLYAATLHGVYGTVPSGRRPYGGFRLLSMTLADGHWTVHAQGPAGEGLVAGVLDAARGIYHGLTYPRGLLVRHDLATGVTDVVDDPALHTPGGDPSAVCRALAVDGAGTLFGSRDDGRVWRREPGCAPTLLEMVSVHDGALPPLDDRGRADGRWRALVWVDTERAFYGVHAGSCSLFRFDPAVPRITPLARLSPRALHQLGHARYRSQLGLVLHGRTLSYLAHGPAVLDDRPAPLPERSVYLVSYDLDSGLVTEHGPMRTTTGGRVIFCESLAADPRGRLYTTAWVESSDPAECRADRGHRAASSNSECRDEIYRMQLLRLTPTV